MGRPLKVVKRVRKVVEKEIISFHIPVKDKNKLLKILKKHGMTQSELMRTLVMGFIEDATKAAVKGAIGGVMESV